MKLRGGYTIQDFMNELGQIDTDIVQSVWDALRHEATYDNFIPWPNDDLCKVFGIAEEELDDLVLMLLNRLQISIPSAHEMEGMDPVLNVKDLVFFLHKCRDIKRGEQKRVCEH